jgi:hypothetical protein
LWDYRGSKQPYQCARCKSYDIIPEQEYQTIIQEARNIKEDSPFLRLEVLKVILKTRGLKFQPISTINLVERVLDDIFPEQIVGAYITPDGRIFYHKIRKKKDEETCLRK